MVRPAKNAAKDISVIYGEGCKIEFGSGWLEKPFRFTGTHKACQIFKAWIKANQEATP